MHGVLSDIRQAARRLARERGFTVVALLTLGLGVGACTAMFSLVDRLLIRPLPFPAADRLVRVTVDHESRRAADVGLGAQELFDLVDRADLFAGVSGLYPINVNLTGGDEPERIEMQLVSVGYFELLGVPAQVGRVFEAGDYQPGIAEVAVISDGLWTRRFGRDPSVLGRKVRLDNDLFTIVGVMPRGFHQPSRGLAGDAELWAPSGYRATPFQPPVRAVNFLAGVLARLQDGRSVSAVQGELDRMSADLVRAYPDAYPAALGWRLRLVPLKDDIIGSLRPALTLLMGAVLLVLLIGCANLANLLLVRADARVPEVRMRLALGASPGRIIRQSLVESGLVSLVGAGVGLLAGSWALDALVALSPVDLRALGAGAIDERAALFAVGITGACAALFGLAPAWRSARVSLVSSTSGRVAGDTPAARRTRDVLVVGQSAVALMLLVGALLMLRSVGALLDVPAGFDPTAVTTARFWMPQPNDPASGPYFRHEQRLPFYRRLLERVAALPGVEAAGVTNAVPLADRRALQGMLIEGRPVESVDTVTAQTTLASPGYFAAMRSASCAAGPSLMLTTSALPGWSSSTRHSPGSSSPAWIRSAAASALATASPPRPGSPSSASCTTCAAMASTASRRRSSIVRCSRPRRCSSPWWCVAAATRRRSAARSPARPRRSTRTCRCSGAPSPTSSISRSASAGSPCSCSACSPARRCCWPPSGSTA